MSHQFQIIHAPLWASLLVAWPVCCAHAIDLPAAAVTGSVDSSFIRPRHTMEIALYPGTHRNLQSAGMARAVAQVEQDANACTFAYRLTAVPAGTYTLALIYRSLQPRGSSRIDTVIHDIVQVGAATLRHDVDAQDILRVGPTRRYQTVAHAAAVALEGAVIEVDAGDYPDDIVVWRRAGVVVRGVGERRPHIKATAAINSGAADHENGKGLWVVQGEAMRIENLEFSGARVRDRNGAAVRNEARDLTLCNGYFHHNENGFLGVAHGVLTIEYSTFAYNGSGDGYTHNVYVVDRGERDAQLIFRFNNSHHVRIGHLLKTRAPVNHILYNRLMDERDGTSSYNIDVPNGGETYIVGNVLQQSALTDNPSLVSFGAEGLARGRRHEIHLINNTLVNERAKGAFVTVAAAADTFISINNLYIGAGAINDLKRAAARSERTGSPFDLQDHAAYDYRLTARSAARNAGSIPEEVRGVSWTPLLEYQDEARRKARSTDGQLDVGAFEFER